MFENYFSEYGASVVGGAIFLTVACVFAVWIDRVIRHFLVERAKLDAAVATVLARTIRISIWVLAGVAVLEELGVEISSLIAALGIFGFAIAIGFRTTANNFFTGVMIFILKPYKIGDYIDGERVQGIVESMSLFHTVLVTDDGIYTAVPNGSMWARSVKNFSRLRPRRLELDIVTDRSKPYEEFSRVIEKTVSDEAALMHDLVPLIRITEVSETKITIRVSVWCDVQHTWDVTQRFSTSLKQDLQSVGVDVESVNVVKRTIRRPRRPATAIDSDD